MFKAQASHDDPENKGMILLSTRQTLLSKLWFSFKDTK